MQFYSFFLFFIWSQLYSKQYLIKEWKTLRVIKVNFTQLSTFQSFFWLEKNFQIWVFQFIFWLFIQLQFSRVHRNSCLSERKKNCLWKNSLNHLKPKKLSIYYFYILRWCTNKKLDVIFIVKNHEVKWFHLVYMRLKMLIIDSIVTIKLIAYQH